MAKIEYKKRIIDNILDFKLKSKGAVLIEGCKWCGKTTTGLSFSSSVIRIDSPDKRDEYIRLSYLNPSFLLDGKTPRLIDEWQIAPRLWDAVRYKVDERGEFGQFILTGSSVPVESEEIIHSGIGRIVSIVMRPMSLYESGESNGSVSLFSLFDGKDINGHSNLTLKDIAFLTVRGGWPISIQKNNDVSLQQGKDFYRGLIERDIHKVSKEKIDTEKYNFFMKSYARNIGSMASLSKIAYGIENEERLARITADKYLSLSKKIFVIEELEAYSPLIRSRDNLRTSPKRYFVDPSIATSALHVGPERLMSELNTLGFFFENLVIRDLKIYADSFEGKVYHYRDKQNLECDAVISLEDDRYGLIEIKLATDRIDEAVKTLTKVEKELVSRGANKPSFSCIIVGIGEYAYRLENGIYVVPIGTLKN